MTTTMRAQGGLLGNAAGRAGPVWLAACLTGANLIGFAKIENLNEFSSLYEILFNCCCVACFMEVFFSSWTNRCP